MPELTREELWRQLKQDFLAPVYLLFGPETYLRDRAAAEITQRAFQEGELRDFNLDEFSSNNKEAAELAIAAAQQLPMMSARRVVKLTDVRVTASAMRDTLKEDCEPMLARYLSDPSPSSVVIIVADELNGNRKISRLLKNQAVYVEFKQLEDGGIADYIRRSVREHGVEIEERALRHLTELVGPDLRRLTNEINKISVASFPSGMITFELVEGLVPSSNELENFRLTNAIVSGRRQHALRVLKKILDDGAEPVALIGLLAASFRRLLTVKEMMSRGDDRRSASGILRMPYREQEDFLAAARRTDKREIFRVFDRLHETDVAMKTSLGGGGSQGTRMQIEVLVCEMSGALNRPA